MKSLKQSLFLGDAKNYLNVLESQQNNIVNLLRKIINSDILNLFSYCLKKALKNQKIKRTVGGEDGEDMDVMIKQVQKKKKNHAKKAAEVVKKEEIKVEDPKVEEIKKEEKR